MAASEVGELAPVRERTNHVCWVFEDPAPFRARAAAFLSEGLDAGHRLEYLSGDSVEEVSSRLEAVPRVETLLGDGALTVRSLTDIYGIDEVVDPADTVATYAAATRDAVAAGYRGLRVVAEATALVRTPAQRAAFARYEHLVDRYMLDHPFFALCGYDAGVLGRDVAAEIACLHPEVSSGATTFRWCAAAAGDVLFAGEVDIASEPVFDVTLARTMPLLAQARFEVDARALEFVDHRGLLTLDRRAGAAGTQVTLLTDAPGVHRLLGLLDLEAVRAGSPS